MEDQRGITAQNEVVEEQRLIASQTWSPPQLCHSVWTSLRHYTALTLALLTWKMVVLTTPAGWGFIGITWWHTNSTCPHQTLRECLALNVTKRKTVPCRELQHKPGKKGSPQKGKWGWESDSIIAMREEHGHQEMNSAFSQEPPELHLLESPRLLVKDAGS